jgi:tight adherence protein B
MILAIIGAVAAFVAVSAIVALIVRSGSGRQLERRFDRLQKAAETSDVGNVLLTDSGTFPFLRRFVTGSAWADATALKLRQAGSRMKVSEYLLIRAFLATIAGVVIGFLLRDSSIVLPLAIVAGLVGYMVPSWILQMAQARRVNAINGQLAETLSLVANALRSGFAFTQAVELATKQVESPIRDELLRYLRDVSLGASTEVALQELADRTASYDLEMMVATILVQRNTGGNLSEILDNVADTIRERERIAGEIRALTASQRLTGLILSIYPIFLASIFFLLAPDLMRVLVEEELGRALLVVAITLQVIGIVTIRRILRPEI